MESKQNKTVVYQGGIGFCGLLTIVLIVLKLIKVIDISWIWVFSPLWIPTALYVAGLIIYLLIICIIFGIKYIRARVGARKLRKWRQSLDAPEKHNEEV